MIEACLPNSIFIWNTWFLSFSFPFCHLLAVDCCRAHMTLWCCEANHTIQYNWTKFTASTRNDIANKSSAWNVIIGPTLTSGCQQYFACFWPKVDVCAKLHRLMNVSYVWYRIVHAKAYRQSQRMRQLTTAAEIDKAHVREAQGRTRPASLCIANVSTTITLFQQRNETSRRFHLYFQLKRKIKSSSPLVCSSCSLATLFRRSLPLQPTNSSVRTFLHSSTIQER